MQRERITDDIYVFTSDLYAQVTASLILCGDEAVLIDTLPFPEETRQIRQFAQERLKVRVRYVVNTHYHADHTLGTCLFDGAQVISHMLCRTLLEQRGAESVKAVRDNGAREMFLVLPDLTFDRNFTLRFKGKTLQFKTSPGHSPDSIVCYIEEDQVLIAADTVMPIPYFLDGSFDAFLESLRALKGMSYEAIVQGHGEVVLRGEVKAKLQSDIDYLHRLRDHVDEALKQDDVPAALNQITIESCGKSRVLLNGAAHQLHRQNVVALAEQRRWSEQQSIS